MEMLFFLEFLESKPLIFQVQIFQTHSNLKMIIINKVI